MINSNVIILVNINQKPTMQNNDSFKFKVDLFNYGTYNELVFIPQENGYIVNLDNERNLGRIEQNTDLTWQVKEGNISATMLNEIVKCFHKRTA